MRRLDRGEVWIDRLGYAAKDRRPGRDRRERSPSGCRSAFVTSIAHRRPLDGSRFEVAIRQSCSTSRRLRSPTNPSTSPLVRDDPEARRSTALAVDRRSKTPSRSGSASERDRPTMSSASATTARRDRRLHRGDLRGASSKGRDEPAWLRRAPPRGVRARSGRSPGRPLRDEEWRRTDIRAFKLDAFAPPPGASPSAEDRAALGAGLGGPERRTTPPGSSRSTPSSTRTADPAKLGGAVFVDLATAVEGAPELLEQLPADRGRPARRPTPSRPCTRRSGPAGRCSTCPKGVKVEVAAVQPGRAGRRRGGSTWTTRWSSSKRGPRRRSSARPPARAGATPRPCTPGPSSCSSATGRKLRFVNIQNWDAGTWHFSRERALVGRDAAIQWTVGGLGSRLAKVNQEVALTGQGADGPGQRRDVHHRPAAPRLLHPPGPPRPPHHERPALQGRPEGPARGSSGRG